jgi:hypothetical protein
MTRRTVLLSVPLRSGWQTWDLSVPCVAALVAGRGGARLLRWS